MGRGAEGLRGTPAHAMRAGSSIRHLATEFRNLRSDGDITEEATVVLCLEGHGRIATELGLRQALHAPRMVDIRTERNECTQALAGEAAATLLDCMVGVFTEIRGHIREDQAVLGKKPSVLVCGKAASTFAILVFQVDTALHSNCISPFPWVRL